MKTIAALTPWEFLALALVAGVAFELGCDLVHGLRRILVGPPRSGRWAHDLEVVPLPAAFLHGSASLEAHGRQLVRTSECRRRAVQRAFRDHPPKGDCV